MRCKSPFVQLLILCLSLFLTIEVNAQPDKYVISDSATILKENKDSLSQQKDVKDVFRQLFKKDVPVIHDSIKVRPGKLLFALLPGIGYTLVTGLTAVTSVNASFYTGKSNNTYLSTINTVSEFSLIPVDNNHQLVIPIESNIWTKGNKYNLIGDWRYYKYPTYTYGLGGHSSLSNPDLINYSYIRFYQEVLKKIHSGFYTGIGYDLDYHFDIKAYNPGGDFAKYTSNATSTVSSGMLLHLLYDSRKNVNNPQGGFYTSIAYRPNFTFLGSNQNWQSVIIDLRKYIRFPAHKHNILAFWSYNWFTFGGKVPYFDLPSTGWDTYSSTGRGYIQGRLRSNNLVYVEAEYRFGILKNGLLGGVVFANAQSVTQINTFKFEGIFPATGFGIRIKVNKLSNANFDIDYGVGLQGSRGLFLNLCEIF